MLISLPMTPVSHSYTSVATLQWSNRYSGPWKMASQWKRNQWCRFWVYSNWKLLYLHIHTSPEMRWSNRTHNNLFFQESQPIYMSSSQGASLPDELSVIRAQGRAHSLLLVTQLLISQSCLDIKPYIPPMSTTQHVFSRVKTCSHSEEKNWKTNSAIQQCLP